MMSCFEDLRMVLPINWARVMITVRHTVPRLEVQSYCACCLNELELTLLIRIKQQS